jgi:hypothetical protein
VLASGSNWRPPEWTTQQHDHEWVFDAGIHLVAAILGHTPASDVTATID